MGNQSIRFIGDVHGKFGGLYHYIAHRDKMNIQVGDMGLGFSPIWDSYFEDNLQSGVNFIRGNHDNPAVCQAQLGFINSGYDEELGIFFVNGGWSIDGPGRPWCQSVTNPGNGYSRADGIDFWSDEEHIQPDLDKLVELYIEKKPKVVVSHEGPITATRKLFSPREEYNSRTALALEKMWKSHRPDLWIFGHWHRRRDQEIAGCRFICLQELGYIDLEV